MNREELLACKAEALRSDSTVEEVEDLEMDLRKKCDEGRLRLIPFVLVSMSLEGILPVRPTWWTGCHGRLVMIRHRLVKAVASLVLIHLVDGLSLLICLSKIFKMKLLGWTLMDSEAKASSYIHGYLHLQHKSNVRRLQ